MTIGEMEGCSLRGALVLLLSLGLVYGCGDDGDGGSTSVPDDTLVIDVASTLRPINRGLSGFHDRPSVEGPAAYRTFVPTTHRAVASAGDGLHYDCASETIDQESLDRFGGWLDAVDAQGADAILSLSYVPECIARDGQAKGRSTDPTVYRRFIDTFFDELITQRLADGKRPLQYFELWNEPDLPVDRGNPTNGHGFVGSVDEYIETILPHVAASLLEVQATSGVEVHVVSPAAYAPWPISRYVDSMTELFVVINGYDEETAVVLASLTDDTFAEPHGPPASERILHNGGFEWPRRTIDAAERLGLHVDSASVHLYPNTPLLGAVEIGEPEPQPQAGRNLFASPNQFGELAEMWTQEFPEQELFVTEWALSAGVEWRHSTCEGAAFNAASMSVMQDSAIDRALFLQFLLPPADAAMRTWALLPDQQVEATLPLNSHDVWVTAAADQHRTTVLVSQWHTNLDDATDISMPVRILGLSDGTYNVDIESIGAANPVFPGSATVQVSSSKGILDLTEALRLRGQSVVRLDIHSPDTEPLSPLSEPSNDDQAGPCLPSIAGNGPA